MHELRKAIAALDFASVHAFDLLVAFFVSCRGLQYRDLIRAGRRECGEHRLGECRCRCGCKRVRLSMPAAPNLWYVEMCEFASANPGSVRLSSQMMVCTPTRGACGNYRSDPSTPQKSPKIRPEQESWLLLTPGDGTELECSDLLPRF